MRQPAHSTGARPGADLLMVLDEELAGLELVRVHYVQQLSPRSVGGLQILPVKLLQHTRRFLLLHVSLAHFHAYNGDPRSPVVCNLGACVNSEQQSHNT